MATPLASLIASGTKLWLDGVDPDEVARNRTWGATGATSNPIIIADLIETGKFDKQLGSMLRKYSDDRDVAWEMTDMFVRQAKEVFYPVWEATRGNDGYVSFELDPLLEDPELNIPIPERTRQYIELGKKWSAGHKNRMIKVPNTQAGLGALEELAASGVTLNVTLTFSPRQYRSARDLIWRGAQKRRSLEHFKSVYSIFVSRVDVYTELHMPELSDRAQGIVGIINAKRIWRMNQDFWKDKRLPLQQEIVFASTGTKKREDPPWKYVEAFAGSDIETNPPATNRTVQESKRTLTRQVDQLSPKEVLDEIDAKLDMVHMEEKLMEEGVKKFAVPMKTLLKAITQKRKSLQAVTTG